MSVSHDASCNTSETDCSPKFTLSLFDESDGSFSFTDFPAWISSFSLLVTPRAQLDIAWCLLSSFQAPAQKLLVPPLPCGSAAFTTEMLPLLWTHPVPLLPKDVLLVPGHTSSFPLWSRQPGTGWLSKCPSLLSSTLTCIRVAIRPSNPFPYPGGYLGESKGRWTGMEM